MAEPLNFDYYSPRAVRARLGVHISGLAGALLVASLITLLILASVLLLLALPLGWLVLGLAALPIMLLCYNAGELKQLKPASGVGIDSLTDGVVLGRLPKQPTALDIALAVGVAPGGWFMASRFGITASLLQNIATHEGVAAEGVWAAAEELRIKLELPEYTASLLAVAIVRQLPDHEKVLAQIHLDDADIVDGVRWRQVILQAIARQDAPRRTGGVARDWSFGYIPTLSRFGQNISQQLERGSASPISVPSRVENVQRLVDGFDGRGANNVALVGPAGSGKTTVIYSFAERLIHNNNVPSHLAFQQVFMLDASSLISAAPGRGELEQLITVILSEAYRAKNIIICLDNAHLFFEEGVGSINLSSVLQPILEAGNVRIIIAMDEQRYLQISQQNPALVVTLNQVRVTPSTAGETMEIMQEQVIREEGHRKVHYTYQSLKEAHRLSERYMYDMAQPGKSMKLLEMAARHNENGLVTMNSVQQAIETTMDVKVSVADTTEDRERLLNMEELIHRQMIGQQRAVSVVSDALRRARAGVRNEQRPVGTFLFLGPTGVGKTQLAKSVSNVYFGGEKDIVRLDLNQFVRSDDVGRLIADGANDPMSLTAQVMKKPFSVVLLDEIEKAHPDVLATLLQVLDEGVLRDENNREVSFRDVVIVCTSNAGADRIREYIERGYDVTQFEQQFLDELINSNQFRPEFLNRFDEIVVFTPLSKPELLQVVDLILAGVNKTLAQQKVSVVVDQTAKELLVERGYDARLGARPMRRVVQKAVENTVAKAMLAGTLSAGGTITIDAAQVGAILGSAEAAEQIRAGQPNPIAAGEEVAQ